MKNLNETNRVELCPTCRQPMPRDAKIDLKARGTADPPRCEVPNCGKQATYLIHGRCWCFECANARGIINI